MTQFARIRSVRPVVVAALAVGVAGCSEPTRAVTDGETGQAPAKGVERALEQALAARGLSGARVTCSKELIVDVGAENSCVVTNAGRSTTVRFTFSNTDGAIAVASVKPSS